MPIPQVSQQICSRPFGEEALSIARKIIGAGQSEVPGRDACSVMEESV
jgi:hypothetical protein